MNKFKRFMSLVLVLCMVMAFVPVGASAAEDASYAYNIVHVDAGRKYFSVENLKTIIDNAADAGFNQVQLYLSDNQGFRFALDDMSITTDYGTYDLTPALGDGYSDGSKYPDYSGRFLTQTEMTEIIAYANEKGIDIVPCINVPGHMGAILEEFSDFCYKKSYYSVSKSSIDLNNDEAVAFALALTAKYAEYFASQGCKFYNVGADEYANDLSAMGFEGMGSAMYTKFVQFLNDAADIIIDLGMTPRAFNDGFYYRDYNIALEPNKAYEVCYWSSGWNGYEVAFASDIAAKGHKMINTHGDYYWVLGNTGWQCSPSKASQFETTVFPGSNVSEPAGSMFCIWCDVANTNGADGGAAVAADTANVIAAFGAALPDVDTLVNDASKDEPVATEPVETEPAADDKGTEKRTITLFVGETKTEYFADSDYTGDYSNESVTVSAVYETVAGGTEFVKVASITSGTAYYIQNSKGEYLTSSAGWTSSINSAAKWTATANGSGYRLTNGSNYLRYSNSSLSTTTRSSSATTWSFSNGTFSYSGYNSSYTLGSAGNLVNTEPKSGTTVTFTGVKVGTTTVTVGNVEYTVNVVAEDLSKVTPLTVSFWVTNRRVTANGATSMTIDAEAAYGKNGVRFSSLVPATGAVENNEMIFWKGTRLPSGFHQEDSGADRTLSSARTDFNYIRYYGGSWAYSVDGTTWVNAQSTDQFVAYYLQTTEVTSEVTTNVVDWGEVYSDWKKNSNTGHWFWGGYVENGSKYVFLDFAVVYEDNTQNPASFPTDNTWFYHFDGHSASNPRVLGAISFTENEDYEIWRVTVTDGTSTGYSKASTFKPTYNDDTETTVWDESMGGEPSLDSLSYTANRSGKLIRVYVRAKVTPDALTVHYMDRSANDIEFYSYNIAVNAKDGTVFHEDFGMGTDKNSLVNNEVINIRDVKQTVSADLQTMPEIKAYYRYCNYSLVDTERSEDGKHVYLYYTFTPVVAFVADFGLPLEIKPTDLNQEGYTTEAADIKAIKVIGTYDTEAGSTAHAEYGDLAVNGTTVTYTPTKPLQDADFFTIFVITQLGNAAANVEEVGIAYRVYIFPATTVYYDETFATLNGSWTASEPDNDNQELQKAGEAGLNYGYTEAGMERTAVESSTIGNTASFSFTGTGIEIYANATEQSGMLTAVFYSKELGGRETVKRVYQVDTAAKVGDTSITGGQNQDSYGLPVVSVNDLPHGAYRVELIHTGISGKSISLDGFRVTNTLGNLGSGAYVAAEKDPAFIELRNAVLTGMTVENENTDPVELPAIVSEQIFERLADDLEGALVLSGDSSYDVLDLLKNGPKNELFLRKNESVSFDLGSRTAQIGLKALNGQVTYTVNGKAAEIDTAVDMFYGNVTGKVTIVNTGDNILSVTKLKVFGAASAAEALEPISEKLVTHALQMMGIIEKPEPVNPFVDVTEDSWYYDSVLWAVENGITNGADATHFLPDALCQRASVVTFLWRAAGSPEPETTVNPFVDVTEDTFFYKAVLWAVENGITNGVDATHFAPFGTCNRAQVVTFLWRANGSPAASAVNPFADVAEGQWYTDAIVWAAENGITDGMSGTIFGVDSICNRAQIVTFLYRASVK